MKKARLILPICLFSILLHGPAKTHAVALNPEQELFFSQFRTAIAGEDARKLMNLTHPQAQQCTKDDDREDYYGLIMKGLVQMLGRKQTIMEIESKKVDAQALKHGSDAASQSGMSWPVTPEEQLVVKYEKEDGESSATLYIARDQDQWKWVHLCHR